MTKNFVRLAAFAFAVATVGSVSAAEIMPVQDFSALTVGSLVGQDGWDSTGTVTGVDFITVATGDNNHPGQTSIAGDRSLLWDGGGNDIGKSFTVQSADPGTTLYYSMVLTATDTGTFNAGGYFAHFTEGTSAAGSGFRGRAWIGEATGLPVLGIDITSGDTPVLAPNVLAYGTPIFVVVKLTYNAGVADDVASIFINQTGPTEGTADAFEGGIDFVAIGRFGLRQDAATDTPTMSVDNVRTGTTWADVVKPLAAGVGEWEMYN